MREKGNMVSISHTGSRFELFGECSEAEMKKAAL